MALCDILFDSLQPEPSKMLYIYSNICSESIVDGYYRPLLRQVKLGGAQFTFSDLHYLSVNKTQVDDIEFCIKDEINELASFLTDSTSIMLHFCSYPFFV